MKFSEGGMGEGCCGREREDEGGEWDLFNK